MSRLQAELAKLKGKQVARLSFAEQYISRKLKELRLETLGQPPNSYCSHTKAAKLDCAKAGSI